MAVEAREQDYLSMAVIKFPTLMIEVAELAENIQTIYFKRLYNDPDTGLISEDVMAEINQFPALATLEAQDISNMVTLASALSTVFGDKTSGALSNCTKIVNPRP